MKRTSQSQSQRKPAITDFKEPINFISKFTPSLFGGLADFRYFQYGKLNENRTFIKSGFLLLLGPVQRGVTVSERQKMVALSCIQNKADRHKSRAIIDNYNNNNTCIFALQHICTLAHLHICILSYLHISILALLHTCTFAYFYICIFAYLHFCILLHLHTCIFAYMHNCTCAYWHICTLAHWHALLHT